MTSIRPLRLNVRLRIAAAVLAAVSQLSLSSAVVLDARSGADAVAHVEASGTQIHHAHDQTNCAFCRAQQLTGSLESACESNGPAVLLAARPTDAPNLTSSRAAEGSNPPRAPPVAI